MARLPGTTIEFTLTGTNVGSEYRTADGPHQILADHFQIERAIKNLIVNAVQAMPEGGKVSVKAANADGYYRSVGTEEAQDHVRIEIIDQGMGIPPECIENVFDPFFTTREKGTGPGSSTVQSIVKNHNGSVEMGSEVGLGTSFTILLPACEKAVTEGDGRRTEEVVLKGSRIPIKDDEEVILEVLSTILGGDGAQGGPGEERRGGNRPGVKVAIRRKPVRPPHHGPDDTGGVMGGKDAMQEILRLDPATKAMVSSGHSHDPVMSQPKKYGFVDVLPSPAPSRT